MPRLSCETKPEITTPNKGHSAVQFFNTYFRTMSRIVRQSFFPALLWLCTSFVIPTPPLLEVGMGRVVKIVDGDTYDILIDGVQTRIRMDGIDAPEKGQAYYQVSKDFLGGLCDGQTVRLEVKSKDRYGRTLARTYLAGNREVGAEMVRAGLAWHYKKYSDDADLARLEDEARKGRKGLWADANPIAPWDYRKMKRSK